VSEVVEGAAGGRDANEVGNEVEKAQHMHQQLVGQRLRERQPWQVRDDVATLPMARVVVIIINDHAAGFIAFSFIIRR
jgi:hypothetical protein